MLHSPLCMVVLWTLVPLTPATPCTQSRTANGLRLDCSHRHLTSLPVTHSQQVTQLDVSHNDVTNLPPDPLSSWLPALQQLDVSHNSISDVEERSLQGLCQLHDLDLSYNQLHVIRNDTFRGLSSSLHTLALSYNGLTQLQDDAFQGLGALTSLRLDHNRLASLTASVFRGLGGLRELDLSHNALQGALLNHTFCHLPALRSLQLHHNQLQRLHPAALTGLTQLEDLDINDNQLEPVHWSLPPGVFADLVSVQRFSLKFNSKADLGGYPQGVFGDLTAVTYLALDTFVDTEFGAEFGRLRHIHTLDVDDACKVTRLRNTSLLGFRNSSLHSLVLTNCHALLYIETCAFCQLPHLKSLRLTHNNLLHPGLALLALYGLQGQAMEEVDLRAVGRLVTGFHTIDRHNAKYLRNVCVRRLNMAEAHLQRVVHDALFDRADSAISSCLQHLDLSDNHLDGDLGVLLNLFLHCRNLTSLHLQEQHLYSLRGSACVLGHSLQCPRRGTETPSPWLETLHLPLPPTLQYLDLSACFPYFNPAPRHIHAPSARSLTTLDLSFGFTSHCVTTFTGFDSLQSLDLSGNYCNNISDDILDHLPSLRHLSLSSAHLDPAYFRSRAQRLLQKVERLESLDLSWNWLVEIQQRSLPAQPRLQRLLLSHNSFQSLPVSVDLHPNLTDLDLSFNSLTSLTPAERASLDELASRHPFRLNLSGNPLLCACSNLDFLRWLWDTHVILDGDGSSGRRYTCTLDTGEITDTERVMAEWESLWRRCIGQRVFGLALACFLLQLLGLMTAYLVTRSWTHIVYAWKVLRHLRLPVRQDFRKDAYVVHAEADTEFVFLRLRPSLEQYGVRLLLRHLEDVPGSVLAQNIVQHIEDSWKVVLVVTQAFSQCDWSCSYTVQQAQRSISDTLPDRVLVLFLDPLRDLQPMASLEALLRNYPEKNVLHAHRDLPLNHPAWRALADAILGENRME